MNRAHHVPRVLLVDDDPTFRQVLAAELSRRGLELETASSGAEALAAAQVAALDVVLLDLRLPDMDGIEVLRRLREMEQAAGVVLLTGHGTIDTAIEATRLGAYDYLEKPCPVDKVEMTIRKTCEHLGLLTRQQILIDGFTPPDRRQTMVGRSPAFRAMIAAAERIGPAEATTLILGETGAGKDLAASLIHTLSPRREAPFVVVDCTALQEDLLQSELFGHEKGSFSGAIRRKHGLFEVADGGTLFLDEIGELSPEVQSSLLRVLESGSFRRLGGTEELRVDVRVLSATNRNLTEARARGGFREDLYYRLSTLTLEVPPLRERGEDIPLLVEHFQQRLNRRLGRRIRITAEALGLLCRYSWPGNVRELAHVLEQAFVLARGDRIRPEDLSRELREATAHEEERPAPSALPSLAEVEWRHIRTVLGAVGENRAKAAEILGISERNLYRLIRKHEHPETGS